MTQLTEDELLNLLNDLNTKYYEKALKTLHTLYFEKLFKFIHIYIQSEKSIEEIISDIFIFIWENREQLKDVKNFNAYIFAIARNKAISHYRKEEKYLFTALLSENTPYTTKTDPEQDIISSELTIRFDRAIESLPPQCKAAFRLIREEKMKYKEAAAILNVSVKTLETQITKATKILLKVLQEEKIHAHK